MTKLRRVCGLAVAVALGIALGGAAPAAAQFTFTEFSSGISPGAYATKIAAGPGGALWFTESSGDRIGRLSLTAATSVPTLSALGLAILGTLVAAAGLLAMRRPT